MHLEADLKHIVYALSDALDLVGIDDVAHGKRVGIMAAACSRQMGHPEPETGRLFELGMLHDIGVSSTRTHNHLVTEFDWEGSQVHAMVGCQLLADFAPLAWMAQPIRYHHTRWDSLRTLDLDAAVAYQANLILLVDRVDAMAAPYYASNTVLRHREGIRQSIAGRSGTYFAPDLVEVFLAASRSEAFWLELDSRSVQYCLKDFLGHTEPYRIPFAELRQLATIFSRIVDAKSPFTAEHSLGVARVARLLAEKMGVSEENLEKLVVAALLHDLGKLRVPDEILDKPGKLDPAEREIINAHSFDTYQILHNIAGFEEIARWAAYHHEEPDGSGYPFRVTAAEQPLEARILRVADIFQAMAQDRPYRPGWNVAEVVGFLRDLAGQGRIDREIFAVVAAHAEACMTAARPMSASH